MRLRTQRRNANRHTQRGMGMLEGSIQQDGWIGAITTAADGETFDGSARVEVTAAIGMLDDPIVIDSDGTRPIVVRRVDIPSADDPRAKRLGLAANRVGQLNLEWEPGVLAELAGEMDLSGLFRPDELADLAQPSMPEPGGAMPTEIEARKSLVERFGVPPFSVLDARQGYWQARKRAWIALGIESEIGRFVSGKNSSGGKNSAFLQGQDHQRDGGGRVSVFDPVLCELVYRWFCPEGGIVLDPFAGGSVRGIVATQLGRGYTGIDLRSEQIAANEAQAQAIGGIPHWIVGDSRHVATLAPGAYDLIFSCPPYADLERYSDDPADLSTMEHAAFIAAYCDIIAACVSMLKEDRFACFVVGDVRDSKGFYLNFVSDTIAAFEAAGARLYNEAILVTALGSLPIRIAEQFEGYRKLGKAHQNVLVFYKGSPKRIKDFAPVEMGDGNEWLTHEAD